MGMILSTTMNVIQLVDRINKDKEKDDIQEEEIKREDILKPIEPPKYYSTIEARKNNVKEGPYTVEAISESLKNNLVPIGYSLEQLEKVGFSADVREFKRRRDERNENYKKDLVEGLENLKKEIEKGIVSQNDLTQEDRDLIKKNNILNPIQRGEYINKLDRWLSLAKKDVLSPDVLSDMTKILNFKISDYRDVITQENIRKQNRQIVDNAVLNRDKKILNSVKRAFRNGYFY